LPHRRDGKWSRIISHHRRDRNDPELSLVTGGQKAICEFVGTKKGRQTMKHVLRASQYYVHACDLQMAVAGELRGIP